MRLVNYTASIIIYSSTSDNLKQDNKVFAINWSSVAACLRSIAIGSTLRSFSGRILQSCSHVTDARKYLLRQSNINFCYGKFYN